MYSKLKEIVDIQSGIYEKIRSEGSVLYLQVSDFKNGEYLKAGIKPMIMVDDRVNKYILKDKDLLFAAKGTSNFCVMYRSHEEKAVASSSFFVLRVVEQGLDPEYVCWFLNTPHVLTFLRTHAVGTSIPSITKKMLADLEINILPLPKQRLIVEYNNLQNREIELHALIAQKKRLVADHLLYNVTNKTK